MAIAIGLTLLLLVLALAPWLLLLAGAPLWAPLAIDAALLCIVVVAAVARWLAKRHKAATVERALAPKPLRDPTRPDRAAEIEEIRRELDAAFGAIARSRLGGGGRAALDALPWYVVLGSPGAGKSTLLAGSGLTFPTAPNMGHADAPGRALGSTKRCEVWAGNEAVLLDTSGRWCVSDDDADWCALLDRLRAHRRERALDGVLLTLALDELVATSETERSALARRLRARVESISQQLGVAIPVYVVVTKCDQWVGFSETFASLDKRQRVRPWGFTVDASSPPALEELVLRELASLVGSLRARVASTLANERRVEARALVAELPAHFASVIEPLASVVSQIFVTSVYGETPSLRGLYFTSATQKGRPMDRLLSTALRASAIEARPLPEATLEPRSYFVHQLLTRVVFADAETAAPSTRAKRRRAWMHVSLGSGAAAFASALVVASAFSWQANRRSIDHVSRALPRDLAAGSLATPETLDAASDALVALRTQLRSGAPFSMRFGLYRGEQLEDVARRRYVAALRDHVLAPLLAAEAGELETWGRDFETDLDREPSADERARAWTLLERQMRFAEPVDPREPMLDAAARTRVAHALAQAWCGSLGRDATSCERHASLALELDRPRVGRHTDAIRVARLGLARSRPDQAMLDALIASTSGRGYDMTLARMVGTSGRALVGDAHVRGAFTRRGWEEVVRARIDAGEDSAERAWMLGTTTESRTSREAMRRAYFAAYAEEWRAFLASVHVSSAADSTEALALLEDLTRGTPPPLGRLLAAVDENAHVSRSAETASAEPTLIQSLTHLAGAETIAPAAATTSDAIVARTLEPYTHFAIRDAATPEDAPLGIDVYGDELALLRDALANYRDDPTASAALETRLVAARRRVDGLVSEQASGAQDFFERLLRPPVEAAALTSSRAMAAAIANGFCAAVVTPFSTSLESRYPFAPHGDDAPLGEVVAFYRPGGTLWSYYDASLATIVPRAGTRFALAARLGHEGGSPYSSQLPIFLERSQTITNGLFAPGSTAPSIELDLRVHPTAGAASVRIAVGGATIDYRNGPETWSRIVWPGATPAAGARLEVESARGLSERIGEDGEWGLFRLVEHATSIDTRPGERTRTVRWHLPGHDVDVVVDVRPVRTECPLFGEDRRGRALGPLRGAGVAAPRRITRGAVECAR